MIICDSSALIYAAKINLLELLKTLYGGLVIPRAVYVEVIQHGKQERYSDAFLLEKKLGRMLIVKDLRAENISAAKDLKEFVGAGEAEAIALCEQEKQKELLINDMVAQKIAEERGIKCRTVLGVLYEALKKGLISIDAYEDSIKNFSDIAWVSGTVVAEFLQAGRTLKGDGNETTKG